MSTEDGIPTVTWTAFGILVVASVLAAVVSYFSGPLAIVIVLAGVGAGNVLTFVAKPTAGSSAVAIEPYPTELDRAA